MSYSLPLQKKTINKSVSLPSQRLTTYHFMDTENVQEQEEVVVQEEETTTQEEADTQEETHDDTVTLSKSEFKKLQRQAIAYKANKETPKPNKEESFAISPEKLERIELRQDGYSKEEVDAIMELGGTRALENPLVKGAIETMRSKAKSQDEKQSLSSKSPIYKKYTKEDFDKMSSADMEKIIAQG